MDTDFHALQELLTARPASDSWLGLAPPMAPMGERLDERAGDGSEDAPVPGWLPGQFAIDAPLVGEARDSAMTQAYGHFVDGGAATQQVQDDESALPDGDDEGGHARAPQAEADGDDTGAAAPGAPPAAPPESAGAGSSEQVFVHEQDADEAPSNASDAGAGGDAPGGGAAGGAGGGGGAPSGAGGGDGVAEPDQGEAGEAAAAPAPKPGDGDDPDAGPTPTPTPTPTPGAEDSDEMQPLDMDFDEEFTFREPEQGAPAQPGQEAPAPPEQEAPAQPEQEAPAQEEFGAAPPVSSALGTTSASRKRQRAQRGISTPLPANAKINRNKTATSQISNATRGVKVSFKRDRVRPGLGTGAETRARIQVRGGPFGQRKGRITKVAWIRVTLTIRTSYGRRAKKHGPSGYGRGTTATDVMAGNSSLRFHEGAHGSASIAYVKKHPLPKFGGRVGQTVAEYNNAVRTYGLAIKAYGKAMDLHTDHAVDEVGTKKSSL